MAIVGRARARARVCISPAPQSRSPKLEITRSLVLNYFVKQSLVVYLLSQTKEDKRVSDPFHTSYKFTAYNNRIQF